MVRVRITCEEHLRDGVQGRFFVRLSRVPNVGEWVYLRAECEEPPHQELGGTFQVTRVQHVAGVVREVDAVLRVRRVGPEDDKDVDGRCATCRQGEQCEEPAVEHSCGGWRAGPVWGGHTWRAGLSGRR